MHYGVSISYVERLPFLSQVKDIEKERLITNNFDSLPSNVTVPPLEVKEVCE